MNTRYTHYDYSIPPGDYATLGRRQAHRRHVLGLLLIGVGMVLLGLRLSGQFGTVPLPISWAAEVLGIPDAHDLAVSVPLAACGMLAAYSIRRA